MWVAILRIVIPLVIIVLLAGFLIPRLRKYNTGKQDRIEVEAEVVNSKQHDPKTDIPKSQTYTSDTSGEGK